MPNEADDEGDDYHPSIKNSPTVALPLPVGSDEVSVRAQNVEATTGIEPVYAVLQTAP